MVNKKLFVSFGITLFILVILILAGPAEAVSINADTEKVNYNTDEDVSFEVSVQANMEEQFQTLTLILNGEETCTFDKDGQIILGCENMNVTLDEKIGYPDIKFDYIITLYNPEQGRYKGFVRVNEANILSKLINFKVRENPRPFEGRYINIRGVNGDIQNILKETGLRTSKSSFGLEMREVLDGNIVRGAGSVLLNIVGKKSDSTRVELQLRADPITIESFTSDSIKLRGPASIEYHRTKKGIWTDNHWIGSEESKRIRRDLSSVLIDIDLKNEHIDVISNSEEKFSIQDIDITLLKIN